MMYTVWAPSRSKKYWDGLWVGENWKEKDRQNGRETGGIKMVGEEMEGRGRDGSKAFGV